MGGSAEIHPESSDQETQAEPMMSWSKAYAHLEKYKITPRLVFEACPSLIELDERGMTHERFNTERTTKSSGATGGKCVIGTG